MKYLTYLLSPHWIEYWIFALTRDWMQILWNIYTHTAPASSHSFLRHRSNSLRRVFDMFCKCRHQPARHWRKSIFDSKGHWSAVLFSKAVFIFTRERVVHYIYTDLIWIYNTTVSAYINKVLNIKSFDLYPGGFPWKFWWRSLKRILFGSLVNFVHGELPNIWQDIRYIQNIANLFYSYSQ